MRVPAPILVALGLAGSVSAYAAPQGLVTVLHAEGATPESSLTLRCLSPELVDGLASQVKGARIRQYDCGTPGLAPNWKIQRHGMRGFYELRNDATGLCMDSTAPHPGAPIVQWPCHGGENQAWRLLPYLKAGAATRFLIQRPYFLQTLCLKGDRDELNPFRGGGPVGTLPGYRNGDGYAISSCEVGNDGKDPISPSLFRAVGVGFLMGTYGIRDLDPKGKVIGREKNGEVALHSRSGTMEALVRGGVGSGDLWEFVPFSTNATSAPSHWQIRHVDTNTCLVDRDGRAILDNCMASADRRWTVGPATSGTSTDFTLKNQSSGKFLVRSPEGSLGLSAAAGEPAIWELEVTGADWAIHGGWSPGIPLYQEDLQPAPPPPPPLPYQRPGGDLNWDQAEAICRDQGASLCTWDDVCPGGQPGTEPRVGILAGDVWMPVGDAHNNWISVGDAYPERLCRPHGELGGLPAWGTTTGPQAVTGVPAAMACCRR